MEHILIAEDDADNNTMLKEYLENHGYICTQAFSGSEAKLLFSLQEFDLILLDLMLPGVTGEELIPLFSPKTPVIVISAKSSLDSKVDLLSAGAEDYLCKPFDLPELLVRIQVQLRRRNRRAEKPEIASSECMDAKGGRTVYGNAESRSAKNCNSRHTENDRWETDTINSKTAGADTNRTGIVSGNAEKGVSEHANIRNNIHCYREWTLDADAMEMAAAGIPIPLTRHEFLILELLIRNPRRVFSKQMIYEYVWGEEYLAEDKTINVHISNIRSKLKISGTDSYIQTVWGMGFKLT